MVLGRFEKSVEEAISLVEFKVKNLKNSLNIESTSDKIKFLNEVAKILSKVDNAIEQEIYIEKIAKEYNVSKEAIYAQINKINRKNQNTQKLLEMPKINRTTSIQNKEEQISEKTIKRENMVIALLINNGQNTYNKIKDVIMPEDFKLDKNKTILQKLYQELEKGNENVNSILNNIDDEELVSHITYIMAYDFEITDINKAEEDLIHTYEREKIISKRNDILKKLEDKSKSSEEISLLEKQLNDIIIKLAKMK